MASKKRHREGKPEGESKSKRKRVEDEDEDAEDDADEDPLVAAAQGKAARKTESDWTQLHDRNIYKNNPPVSPHAPACAVAERRCCVQNFEALAWKYAEFGKLCILPAAYASS